MFPSNVIFQIAFYGLGLNSGIILQAIGFGKPPTDVKGGAAIYQNLLNICIGNMILSVAGLIPGYYATMLLIDSVSDKITPSPRCSDR